MKILIVGLGLIGGSLCKATKKYTDNYIIGLAHRQETIDKALECGAVDEPADSENIKQCDMVIVCLHPELSEKYMNDIIPVLKKNAILTDVCGIKGSMVERITETAYRYGVRYVGAHPMAGKERFGFENSDSELFQNASFIMTPIEKTDSDAVETIKKFALDIGFGKIVTSTPYEHDRNIAYTSQLAHIVSSAYVKSPTIHTEDGFSGGSFQDMTRVATMNEKMWCELFLSNKQCLIEEIDTLIKNLADYKNALTNENYDELFRLIKEGRELKEENLKKHSAN
jgi:prephenate dehydrogenase